MTEVLDEIINERGHQDEKWGEQNHNPFYWLAILVEEVGEASQALLDNNTTNYRNEMVQVAAVAVAAIESLDRGKWMEAGE